MSERVIYRYPLQAATNVPAGKVLKVAWSRGEPGAWIEHDVGEKATQELWALPTGLGFVPEGFEFIDSAISDQMVWHIYRATDDQ